MPSNFYGCFSHGTCGSVDSSKIAKFWAKTMSLGYRSGDVDDVQWRSIFAHKGHNWWRILGVWLWYWNQYPIIPFIQAKVLLTVFFECNGVVHNEFLPQGRTNSTFTFDWTWRVFFQSWLNVIVIRLIIRHQLWHFWANQDHRWTSSTRPERCQCDIVFAQNLAILEQSSLPHVVCLKHP